MGGLDEPLGCCENCGVLACGHHGHRDPAVPAFECALCVPVKLGASAGSVALRGGAGGPQAGVAVELLRLYHLGCPPVEPFGPSPEARGLVRTVNEFVERAPRFRWLLDEPSPPRFRWDLLEPDDRYRIAEQFPDAARALLLAAARLVDRSGIKTDERRRTVYPPALVTLARILPP